MSVLWSPDALEDWRRLSLADAEAVARALEQWDATGVPGTGLVYAAGPAEYRLLIDRFVVIFFLDGDVTHVARVQRRE
jgi:hypothetical protein